MSVSEFKLTELLTFEVDATLIGQLSFKELSKADFTFNADLEQHLLDYIHDELIYLFTKAQLAVEQGIEAVKGQIAYEQTQLDSEISQAQSRLVVAQEKWEAYQTSVTDTNQRIIHDYNAKIQSLQDAIANAEKVYNTAMQNVRTALTNAQHDRIVKMHAAQNDLENATRKAMADIENAKRQVDVAQANMNRAFGSAEGNIESAERKVQGIQSQVDGVNREIDSLKHAAWYKRIKIGGLEIEKGGLETGLKTAQFTLNATEDVLRSADYVGQKAALAAAQKTLDLAQLAGPRLISDSENALNAVDHLMQAAINAANTTLEDVQHGSEKIVFDGAVDTLAAYKRGNDALFEAANKAIANLIQSVEYAAFQTATTGLALARGATKGLNAAQSILSLAEKTGVDVLNVGKAIVDAGDEALNITSIHLSGSLGKSVGGAGFTADVKGVVLKKPFEVHGELNPSQVENFLKGLFQE